MFHDSENIPVSKLREGETAGYPDTPLLSCDILFSSIISTGSERGNGGSGPKDDGPALVYDKTVHHGKNIRFLVRQSFSFSLAMVKEWMDGLPTCTFQRTSYLKSDLSKSLTLVHLDFMTLKQKMSRRTRGFGPNI